MRTFFIFGVSVASQATSRPFLPWPHPKSSLIRAPHRRATLHKISFFTDCNNMTTNRPTSIHQRSKSANLNATNLKASAAHQRTPLWQKMKDHAEPFIQQATQRINTIKKYAEEELDSEHLWVAGHASFLIHFFLYFFGFGSPSGSTFPLIGFLSLWTWEAFYRRACYSLIASYAIVNYKQFVLLKRNAQEGPVVGTLLMDANVLYLLLTLWMTLIAEPFSLSLYTMAIYSFYHVAHWLANRTTSTASPTSNNSSTDGFLAFLQPAFKYQTQVTLLCAHLEIQAVAILLIRFLFLGTTSLLSFVAYLQFIRFQYAASGRTRMAFKELDTFISRQICSNPNVPEVIQQYYRSLTALLARMIPNYKKRED
jgi:hypothetical protein